ncbi:MAG: FAD-dependent oxidoreductase, partial [Herbaspirillum sp.]
AYLKQSQQMLGAYQSAHPVQAAAIYFLIYVAITALSIPGAAVMTLAGGAVFGLAIGTLIVSFASAIGATLAFLVARYLLRDWVHKRFARLLGTIDAGMHRDGIFYLLTLRLVPALPFFAVNLLMGTTAMPVRTYYWVSQLGMLVGTIVYVNAGTQLASIDSLRDVASPSVLGSFAALALFPLLAKWVLNAWRRKQVYRGWKRPHRFDRNVVVIGAGSAGLVTAYIAATVKAKVTLVETNRMGGDCLNTGCVPSKALIRSARFMAEVRTVQTLGIASANVEVDFAQVMQRIQRVVRQIEPHDSVERYRKLGVDVVQGHAKIISPWQVEIDGRFLSTRAIVIAAGAHPAVPQIPGLEEVGYVTSDTIWSIRSLPRRLLVLGGGPIGSELAQAFARFGSGVTQIDRSERILQREDPEISVLMQQTLGEDGVQILTRHEAVRCERRGDTKIFVTRDLTNGEEKHIEFDLLLCAVGRTARTEGYGLEQLGISLTKNKTIDTDGFLQTKYPNIYACGDVAGPYQFTHAAAHQAWYAAVNSLFGQFRRFRVDYRVMPWCTFTSPEVARVGLSEQEAKEQAIAFEVVRYDIGELDRAITDEAAHGFIKVLTEPGKDRILGAVIVAEHAGEMLAEYVLAMKQGIGLNKILGTIHIYPTMSEANKSVAGEWKRQHAPQRLLRWAEKYHTWRR